MKKKYYYMITIAVISFLVCCYLGYEECKKSKKDNKQNTKVIKQVKSKIGEYSEKIFENLGKAGCDKNNEKTPRSHQK